ncbi:MAG TPA: aminotransferase class I/II-fold pyridoxal phosphate-dependent enzyme [Phycisphaerales bacterium]|nr:aminotransferase class I/II-fold pyridoxal phosphate-dependent enzyme [Phycisphaerales bacterium]
MDAIDLRSDTVTQPTPEMRQAMNAAPLGDDVLEGDPSVRNLEAKVAALLGKEAAVFVPSGTMANLLAVRSQTNPGEEIICDQGCHIYCYEAAGFAAISGCSLSFTRGERGFLTGEDVARRVRSDNEHFPRTSLVTVENTHNRGGGAVWPVGQLCEVHDQSKSLGLRVHMDGARLWNACAKSGIEPAEYARCADTVSVCFSKGLGCPVGSALVGDAMTINRARRVRKMVGGSMRQAGMLAAAASYALDHHRTRIADDHRRARMLAEAIADVPGLTVDASRIETNMVYFGIDPSLGTAAEFCRALDDRVRMLAESPQGVRAVLHLHITDDAVEQSARAISDAVGLLAS